MAVYGYTRVGTIRPAAECDSLLVQQRIIGGYGLVHRLPVDRLFVESGVSGLDPLLDRPEGAALMARLAGGDVVITARLDRLFKSALDGLGILGRFRDRRIALHVVDLGGDVSNGVLRLLRTVLSAVAGAERNPRLDPVATVGPHRLGPLRVAGGKPPFGWRISENGEIAACPEQQQALDCMRKLRARGLSLRAVAKHMAISGFAISHVGVKNIMDRTSTE